MTNPNKGQLYEAVANALAGNPAKQPVANATHIDSDKDNDQKKASSKAGMAKVKIKNPNAFSFTKTYPVSIIHKAQAKLG